MEIALGMAVQYESYKFPCVLVTMSANFYEKPIVGHGTKQRDHFRVSRQTSPDNKTENAS